MAVEASVTGLVRTILIIVGVIVLLRFLGQLLQAKRNMEEERKLNEKQRKLAEERSRKLKNFGKTHVVGKSAQSYKADSNTEDVDFEEIP